MTYALQAKFVAEACIEEILSGNRTIGECLEAWPDLRAEIAPALMAVAAMEVASPSAEPPPTALLRLALLEQLQHVPQQSSRRSPGERLHSLLATCRVRLQPHWHR